LSVEGKVKRADDGNGWLILRTGGQRTLPLAKSLQGVGLEAWTPMQVITRRRHRSKESVRSEIAIVPTFVFVRHRHLLDVAAILAEPLSPHPPFSIFRYGGRAPIIADRSLADLRAVEGRHKMAVLRAQRRAVPVGQAVRLAEGPFAGLDGVVEGGNGKYAMVNFGGHWRVEVATWLILGDEVPSSTASKATAA